MPDRRKIPETGALEVRIACPYCGSRDLREFTYRGDAVAQTRPEEDASSEIWDDYLHNRDNPAGLTKELWFHNPCGAWILVERDTITHEIRSSQLVVDVAS